MNILCVFWFVDDGNMFIMLEDILRCVIPYVALRDLRSFFIVNNLGSGLRFVLDVVGFGLSESELYELCDFFPNVVFNRVNVWEYGKRGKKRGDKIKIRKMRRTCGGVVVRVRGLYLHTWSKRVDRTLANFGSCVVDLNLTGCRDLVSESLGSLCFCPRLKSLNLTRCYEVKDLSALGKLGGLEELVIRECGRVDSGDLGVLGLLGGLKKLDLGRCWSIDDVEVLGLCGELRSVDLSCLKIVSIGGLGRCRKLENVCLSGCLSLLDVSILGLCGELRSVNLKGCYRLKEMFDFGGCPRLERLDLRVSMIDNVSYRMNFGLGGFERLGVGTSMRSLSCVEGIGISMMCSMMGRKLRELVLDMDVDVGFVEDGLDCVGECVGLRKLKVRGWKGSCGWINLLVNLRVLRMKRCWFGSGRGVWDNCVELRELEIVLCGLFRDFDSVALCGGKLRKLVVDVMVVALDGSTNREVMRRCGELMSVTVCGYKCVDFDIFSVCRRLKVLVLNCVRVNSDDIVGLVRLVELIGLRELDLRRVGSRIDVGNLGRCCSELRVVRGKRDMMVGWDVLESGGVGVFLE